MKYNLAQLLEQTANHLPDNTAFKCLDESLSYIELNNRANQLANYLNEKGLNKGDRVAIYMNRCLETAIAVYGILKAGGVFVAINPFLPISRTLLILDSCGIEFLLTTPQLEKKVYNISGETRLKAIIGTSKKMPTTAVSWDTIYSKPLNKVVEKRILGDDLASILYTSGSTGMPKGIMHTHANILSLARLEADLHKSDQNDIIGNFAPLYFDQSLFGYFSGPLVGATTVIFPDSYVKLTASLSTLVAKEKITLWFSVPLILIQILSHGDIDNKDFSSLRWVRFGGEVFPVKLLRELMTKWPHAKFINSYGPSELFRCTYHILEEPPETNNPIPLGRVWGDSEYKIIDENDMVVKKGNSGELVVRTSTLMSGYWNNKELTEQSLLRIELASGYDHVFYRTGDLVLENKAGELMFLGRKYRQIKLRGYRIELDEIESILSKNQYVHEAAVIIVNKKGHIKELEAVVGLTKDADIDSGDLVEFCKDYLPPYAVPKKFTLTTDFPRTGTGKIDRNEIIKLLETNAL